MQSKTSLILPGLFRGNEFQEKFLQSGEQPLFQIEGELERFIENLSASHAPEAWLDWLFYALGAEDYLAGDFNTTQKRTILSRLFEMYRSKGTVKGLKLHWEILTGRELLRAEQPPSKSFNSTSLTVDERKAWEANHPEIRVYPFAERGIRRWALMPDDFIGRGYPSITTAGLRLADRVELYDPKTGVKNLLNGFYYDSKYVKRKAKNIVEIRKKGRAMGVFASIAMTASRRCTVNHEAGSRLYNIELYQEYSDGIQKRSQLAIRPSLEPMRGYYENEYIKGKKVGINLGNRYKDVYKDRGGTYLFGSYFAVSTARQRIVRKMKLFDPDRVIFAKRESFNYLNAMKMGALQPHHIEAYVDMSSKAPARAFHLAGYLNDYLYQSGTGGRIVKMRWAGNLARQAGCKVIVSITNRIPLIATMGILCGKYKTGQYIRRA